MKVIQTLGANCLAVLLLLYAHVTKCLLHQRYRFSRRIRLGFMSLVLMLSCATPAAFAQSVLRDTVFQIEGFPICEMLRSEQDSASIWQTYRLHTAFQSGGNVREIVCLLEGELDAGELPTIELRTADGQRQADGMIYEVRQRDNRLWIHAYRKGGQAIDPTMLIRVQYTRENAGTRGDSVPGRCGGIVIVDNINGVLHPNIGPMRDLLDAELWDGYLSTHPNPWYGNENPSNPMRLYPNPVRDDATLQYIPASATKLMVYDQFFTAKLFEMDLQAQSSLSLDFTLLQAGNYMIVVLTQEGFRVIHLIKE